MKRYDGKAAGWMDWLAVSVRGVLGNIAHIWPGKQSRMYQVDAASRLDPPDRWFHRALPVTREQIAADDRPVALIMHGYGSTTIGSHFGPLKAWLTDPAHGRYGLVLGFECDTVHRRIPDLARDLRHLLGGLGLLRGLRRLDLYTHSVGALVARWFLENPEEPYCAEQSLIRTSVRRLIMAGPPNRGTRIAELGDRILQTLRRNGRQPGPETESAGLVLRTPLVAALARRLPSGRLLRQVLDDLQPGSPMLESLRAGSRVLPDSPEYYLIQGVYDPIPAGETMSLRVLREAGALLGDCDARWSDLIVSGWSQTGFEPLMTGGSGLAPDRHLILPQTWHHQYWLDPHTFESIRVRLLDPLPR